MNLKQTIYFMALVGAVAGLLTWFIQGTVADLATRSGLDVGQAQFTILVTTLMGMLIGGMTVGFADKWTADRVVFKFVLMGVILGAVAGLVGGLLYLPILFSVIQTSASRVGGFIGLPLTWLLAGGLIGLVTGLRWASINKLRSVHALIGGLVGGGLGGLLFTFLGNDLIFQALAFMISGMGITLGVTLAPVLMRDGVVLFISSADPRAQNKYGSPQQQWLVQEGDRFVIGSLGSDRGQTMYGRPIDIYIPDAMVAKRHAYLYAREKRFYIQQHENNIGPQGQPLSALQVNNMNVVNARELRDGDEIVLGQTLLKFSSRRQTPPAAQQMAAGRRM
jgi:hypothetical protein